MANESLDVRALRVISKIKELETLLSDTNDYAETTGFCEEQDAIYKDAFDQLGALSVRAANLKRRFEKNTNK